MERIRSYTTMSMENEMAAGGPRLYSYPPDSCGDKEEECKKKEQSTTKQEKV